MIILIEVLIIFLIISMFIIWSLWVKYSTQYHVRRYNKENDKGYQGEQNRLKFIEEGKRKVEGREPELSSTVSNIPGTTKFERSDNLQVSNSSTDGEAESSDGKTSNSNRKISRKFRNPFRRRK